MRLNATERCGTNESPSFRSTFAASAWMANPWDDHLAGLLALSDLKGDVNIRRKWESEMLPSLRVFGKLTLSAVLLAAALSAMAPIPVAARWFSCQGWDCPNSAGCEGDYKDTYGCTVYCFTASEEGELDGAGDAHCWPE